MANDTGVLIDKIDEINLEELEREIFEDRQLENQLRSELSALEETRDQIGNPDALTDTIVNIVWEQFENQVAAQAGEDFIRENHGKNLDLRKDAHIQTTENFEKGKIATHNDRIDYQERFDDWRSNFQKNEDGSVKSRVDNRTGETREVLKPQARAVFDQDRPKGSKTVNIDHVIPAAEIIRDPAAAAHMTKDEQITFANSEINLMDLDAAANQSKGDSKMTDWLESERNGQKPGEWFDIDEDKLKEKDQLAREEYEKKKKEAEGKTIEAGIASRKDEALRIGKKTARAVIMNLLSELVKCIVRKLILWLKSAEKSFETFVKAIKESIKAFISDIRSKVVNVTETAATVIMASIVGPIVNTIKKAWIIIKQGLASLKQAIRHLLDSQNRKKPKDILLMEVGKIILTGVTAVGAMSLGELIGSKLALIPPLNVEIPLFGTIAGTLGIFFGGLVAGVVGALAMDMIDRMIKRRLKQEIVQDEIDTRNKIIRVQINTNGLMMEMLSYRKDYNRQLIEDSHNQTHAKMKEICNEFIIFKKTLKEAQEIDLKDEKLFSIIVFKNLNPKEFAKAENEEDGLVEKVWEAKKERITYAETLYRKRVEAKKQEIKEYEREALISVKEIKKCMIFSLTEEDSNGIVLLKNNEVIPIEEILDDRFDMVKMKENDWTYRTIGYNPKTGVSVSQEEKITGHTIGSWEEYFLRTVNLPAL